MYVVTSVRLACGQWGVEHMEAAVWGGGSCRGQGQDTFTERLRKPGETGQPCRLQHVSAWSY